MTNRASTSPIQRVAQMSALALCLTTCAISAQQIYKHTDENGNVSFSDTKPANVQPEDVEEVELNATNSAPPPPDIPEAETPQETEQEQESIPYESVITSPSDDTTLPMGPGNFAVTASFSPPLRSGERVQLLMDGTPMGGPQRGSAWQLSNVFRGEHSLVAQRIGRGGDVLDSSQPVTVYVLRPSIR